MIIVSYGLLLAQTAWNPPNNQPQVDKSEAFPDLQQNEQDWKLEDGFWKGNEYNGKKIRVVL